MNQFIFSNERRHKFARHATLWIVFCLYFFVVNFFPLRADDLTAKKTYLASFGKMIYIPVSVFSVYVSIYFLLPRFILKGKYFWFVVLFFCLSAFNLANAYLLTKLLVHLSPTLFGQQPSLHVNVFQPILYGMGLGVAASVFALIIKLLKVHYLTQKENDQLQQERLNTELQLIKTNFHPHFLSEALQNISEMIRSQAVDTPAVLLKLSDLLSYTLYESGNEEIQLEKEVEMMRSYLDLEKTFYGNRLVIHLQEEGVTVGKKIAPLILLSLVQNCCEQFLISLQEKLRIGIEIKAGERQLIFRLCCNGYYESTNGVPIQNSRLDQALKRIQAFYPENSQIATHSKNGVFEMELVIKNKIAPGVFQHATETSIYEPA